jgi:hypothetical protein
VAMGDVEAPTPEPLPDLGSEEPPAEETPTEPAEADPTDLSGTGDDSK